MKRTALRPVSAKRLALLRQEGGSLRRTALKAGPGLERRGRVKPVNARRKAARYERDYGGEKADWIRSLPCVVPLTAVLGSPWSCPKRRRQRQRPRRPKPSTSPSACPARRTDERPRPLALRPRAVLLRGPRGQAVSLWPMVGPEEAECFDCRGVGYSVEPGCCGNVTDGGECRGWCCVPVQQRCDTCNGSGIEQTLLGPSVTTEEERAG